MIFVFCILEADYMIKRIERFPKMQIKAKLFNDHCCQLMLSNLPRISIAHLELFLEKVIGEEKEFILKELENRKALLEFKRSMPDEGKYYIHEVHLSFSIHVMRAIKMHLDCICYCRIGKSCSCYH